MYLFIRVLLFSLAFQVFMLIRSNSLKVYTVFIGNLQIEVEWNVQSKSEQISLIAMAMAYIHKSCQAAIDKQYGHHQVELKFFTPLTFKEFTHIFRVMAAHINTQEKVSYSRYDR